MSCSRAALSGVGGPPELFPDPNIQSVDYTTSANVTRTTGQIAFTAATGAQAAQLTTASALMLAFNANIAATTVYDVTITVTNYVSGDVAVRIWNGTAIQFAVTGNGIYTMQVTSGATSAASFILRGTTATPATMNVTEIHVKLH